MQFTDVSYHHDMRCFQFVLNYYLPQDLSQPVLVLRSTPFQVFARRSQQHEAQKRERQEAPEKPLGQRKAKKAKTAATVTPLEVYMNGLEELIKQIRESLTSETERRTALDEALRKLVLTQTTRRFVPILPAPAEPIVFQPLLLSHPVAQLQRGYQGIGAQKSFLDPFAMDETGKEDLLPFLAEGSPHSNGSSSYSPPRNDAKEQLHLIESNPTPNTMQPLFNEEDFNLPDIDALLAEDIQ